jgi:hypothetical protein
VPALLGAVAVFLLIAGLKIHHDLMLLTWGFLREHYLPAMVSTSPKLLTGPITPNTPWVLSTWHTGGTPWWRYIPVSRFWPMQLIEGGWLLALSVLLIAATVWLVRHRAA